MHDAFDRADARRRRSDRRARPAWRRARRTSGTNCRAIGSCGSARSISSAICRRDRDRVARGDRVELAATLVGAAARAPAARSARHAVVRESVLASSRMFSSATGVHSTCSMRVRAGRQHHQPVEAERDAAGRRHLRERRQEILVERIALAVDALLLGHLALEAAALLGRIGQLAEAVGEFDAAGIELEALGDARIVPARPRQRRLERRIFVKDGRAADAEIAARSSRPARG